MMFWYNPIAALEPKYPVMPLPLCVSWGTRIDGVVYGVKLIRHYPCNNFTPDELGL